MKNFELELIEGLGDQLEEMQKLTLKMVNTKSTLIDCEKDPDAYTPCSVDYYKTRFKALCDEFKVLHERYIYSYSELIREQETPPKTELFKQMAEIFRPINSQNFNF